MSDKAKVYFREEWGPGFIHATLQEEKSIVHISMIDIYETMEGYKNEALEEVINGIKIYQINSQEDILKYIESIKSKLQKP